MKEIVLLGYSGHAYVVAEILALSGYKITGYLEQEEKKENPYQLRYLGSETEEHTIQALKAINRSFFVGVGHNSIRKQLTELMEQWGFHSVVARHPAAVVSASAQLMEGTLISAGAIVNAQCRLGKGIILNTGSIVEHECQLGDFTHIGPAAVLAGNVKVGASCLIGAGAVVKPGVVIGNGVTVGAGAVVVHNIPDGQVVAGVPARSLHAR